MAIAPPISAAELQIGARILLVRGQRVMLDADLASIYGVTTGRLNEQIRRNAERFPLDFVFQLTREELTNLMSQIATSKKDGRGGIRKRPFVFTEHGAMMAAMVLRSERAVEMSVFVVRAFVKMREMLSSNAALSKKLDELEQRVSSHDESLSEIISALRQLVEPEESDSKKREIGFHVKNSRTKNLVVR